MEGPFLIYPNMRVERNIRDLKRRPHDLNSVNRILSKRFPELNLAGLAAVPHLLVTLKTEAEEGRPEAVHRFSVFHDNQARGEEGFIRVWQDYKRDRVIVTSLFPRLPAGQRLGMTLVCLILLRGNGFAGKEIMGGDISGAFKAMVRGIAGLCSRRGRFSGESDEGHYKIMTPRLSARELYALEWYWVNILHCPAF